MLSEIDIETSLLGRLLCRSAATVSLSHHLSATRCNTGKSNNIERTECLGDDLSFLERVINKKEVHVLPDPGYHNSDSRALAMVRLVLWQVEIPDWAGHWHLELMHGTTPVDLAKCEPDCVAAFRQ